jgi:hypothetical protein
MLSINSLAPLVVCALATIGVAQITNTVPAVIGFVDLSTFPFGLSVPGTLGNDTEHNVVTTIGNPLFPSGNVRIGNNGVAVSGITTGEIDPLNIPIPLSGVPSGIPTGNGIICAFWDDLYPLATLTPTSIWWKEEAGVLYIMWKNEYHQSGPSSFSCCATFEIQVFSAPGPGNPWIQLLYPSAFRGSSASPFFNGASATVGYVAGTNTLGINTQWSFDTASIPNGAVLSIYPPGMHLTASSPLGPGSLELDIIEGPANGTYFFAATVVPGTFPNGWLFGLDISYSELAAELAAGFPFTGPLDGAGGFSLGPFQGLPPITLYAIAFGFSAGSAVPIVHTSAISYSIP